MKIWVVLFFFLFIAGCVNESKSNIIEIRGTFYDNSKDKKTLRFLDDESGIYEFQSIVTKFSYTQDGEQVIVNTGHGSTIILDKRFSGPNNEELTLYWGNIPFTKKK